MQVFFFLKECSNDKVLSCERVYFCDRVFKTKEFIWEQSLLKNRVCLERKMCLGNFGKKLSSVRNQRDYPTFSICIGEIAFGDPQAY